MERYTIQQRVFIIEQFLKINESLAAAVRKFHTKYGRNSVLTSSTVKRLIEKFRETGSVGDAKHTGRPKTSRSNVNMSICQYVNMSICQYVNMSICQYVNIEAVRESVGENHGTSIRHRGQELQISRSSLQRILEKDLCIHAYKYQLTQQLKPNDHAQRREFVEWIIEHQQVDADFSSKIILSDEAHFHLEGFVNRQNCRVWGSENPHLFVEKQMHPQRVTVWCGFWAGGIIGPYFFENEAGQAVTVTGARYRDMIT